ncbi:MAG: lipopolysaccharide biosynthesis protein, partial [Longimicrobiales bacterium]
AYTAVYPALSGLVAQGDFRRVRSLQRKLSATIAAVVFPVCLVFMVVVTWAIPFLFGQKFQASVPLAQIVVWQVIWTPMLWVPGLLLSMERARLLAGMNWLDALIYVAFLLVLVSSFGVLGAAIATLLRFIVSTLLLALAGAHANRQLQFQEASP